MSRRKSRRNSTQSNRRYYLVGGIAIATIIGYLLVSTAFQGREEASSQSSSASTFTTTAQSTSSPETTTGSKPTILYVNQGNGVVNESNFGRLLDTATSHGFNTIFFQVYRSGTLLFTSGSLSQFVASAHAQSLKIFFALYFTNTTQTIPSSIYSDGEDGINLDMSTLTPSAQTDLLANLSSSYSGKTAVTATDLTTTLKPDLLILETYGTGYNQYIHPGIIAGVGVFTTSSKQQYDQEFQYALANSDGVMVFDYAGLVKAGY
ncbi:MAG TPA: hypothetical protein VND41_01975 [Nitrososphaerales archaeon]|nr:hypothetical protein [Nitrososphaerales archaeon]